MEPENTKKTLYPVIQGDLRKGFDLICLGDSNTGLIPTQEDILTLAAALAGAKYYRPYIISPIDALIEGWNDNLLVVKMGNPATGMVPTQPEIDVFNKILKNHIRSYGDNRDILIWNYGINRKGYKNIGPIRKKILQFLMKW